MGEAHLTIELLRMKKADTIENSPILDLIDSH